MRRLSVVVLVTQVTCALLLVAVTVLLFRKAVIGDTVPAPSTMLAQVFIDGLRRDDLVDVYVQQETAIGQESSLSFSFASDGLAEREGEPLSVEVVFTSSETLDVRCLENDNSYRELGAVDRGQLSPHARREVEVLQWKHYREPSYYDYDSDYNRDREKFWSRVHAYRFTTKSDYLPRSAEYHGAGRGAVDAQRDQKPVDASSFYCTFSPSSVWQRSGGGDYWAFAPAQVATVPQGLELLRLYNPTVLHVRTSIARDFDFTPTQKPDAATANLSQWEFESAVHQAVTGSVSPSDYFVFEPVSRANTQSQYSFWMGISVTFLVTLLAGTFANIFRMATGRSGDFDSHLG